MGKLLGLAVLGALGAVLAASAADIKRYIEMKRM